MIDWINVFLNALPMLLLIGVWIFFMWQLRRGGGWQSKYQTAYLEQLKAQTVALERVAAALEKTA